MLLVTGGTGRSGQWFMRKLSEVGYTGKIRCTVRVDNDLNLLSQTQLNIECLTIRDLRDPGIAVKALEGVNVVVHFAGFGCSKDLILACKQQKVDWAILVHTTGRYSKFKSASHEYIAVEDWVLNSGFNCTIVRPTMIYGSREDRNIYKLIDFMYKHSIFPVFGSGKNLMQPILAKDLGEALYYVLINKEKTMNKCYNLAGKEPLSYKDLLLTVARRLRKQIIFLHVPYFISYWTAVIYNKLSKRPVILVEQVMRMNEDKSFDYSDAARDFGYSPKSFDEGVSIEVEEYLSLLPQ